MNAPPPDDTESSPTADPAAEYARGLQTLVENVQWLQALQPRLHACGEATLRPILDQQVIQLKENLVMVLEWLRQQDPVLDAQMRAYLFQRAEDPSVAAELAPAPPVDLPPAPAPPVTTPAKGLPLTLPNQRIRG